MFRENAFLMVAGVLLISPAILSAQERPAAKPTPPGARGYLSPTAVFDAYRVAIATKDMATEMYCQVKEIREDAYQSYHCMGLAADLIPASVPGMRAAIKKFGAEGVPSEYLKLFEAKHGYDPVKAQADYEVKMNKAVEAYRKAHPKDPSNSPAEIDAMQAVGAPPEQVDEKLLRKVVNEKIVDKAGFVIAMEEAMRNPRIIARSFGPLKNVRMHATTATGVATETMKYNEAGPGQTEKIIVTTSESELFFRKTKEGWLIGYPDPLPRGAPIPPPVAPPPPAEPMPRP